MNCKRLLNTENKLRVAGREGRVRGWAKWVMDIKEGTCWDEHWVLYVSDKSLNSTPETITTLYVNLYLKRKRKRKGKKKKRKKKKKEM